MPNAARTVNYKQETINKKSFKFQVGFSLIELLVVISLFGIAASLVTASYLSFERSQRLKSAANQLKSDVRLVQNDATSGNKYILGTVCNPNPPITPPPILGGWYLTVSSVSGSNTSYDVGGDCITGSGETAFSTKTISLPNDVIISSIAYDGFANPGSLGFLFRPLKSGVTVHDSFAFASGLHFFNNDGSLNHCFFSCPPQESVTITFSNTVGTKTYRLKLEVSGEVNEVSP